SCIRPFATAMVKGSAVCCVLCAELSAPSIVVSCSIAVIQSLTQSSALNPSLFEFDLFAHRTAGRRGAEARGDVIVVNDCWLRLPVECERCMAAGEHVCERIEVEDEADGRLAPAEVGRQFVVAPAAADARARARDIDFIDQPRVVIET